MIKKAYVWLIVALIALILTTAAIIYMDDLLGNAGAQNYSASPTEAAGAYISPAPVTAFEALAIADRSDSVREWKLNKSNLSIEGISTQACASGAGNSWTINYGGDDEKAAVSVDDGVVRLAAIKGPRAIYSLDTAAMIDSDRAFSIASSALVQDGYTITGPASVSLSRMGQYAGVWDLVFPVHNDFYIVRLDAKTGLILTKTVAGNTGTQGMIR